MPAVSWHEVRALAQRARRAGQLAAGEEQRVELVVVRERRPARSRCRARRGTTAVRMRAAPVGERVAERGRPVGELALADRGRPQRRRGRRATSRSVGRSSGRRASAATIPANPCAGPMFSCGGPVQRAASRSPARARPSGPGGARRSCSTPSPSAPRRCARASRRRSGAAPGCPTSARACRRSGSTVTSASSRSASAGVGDSSQATSAIPLSPIQQARSPGRRTPAGAGSSSSTSLGEPRVVVARLVQPRLGEPLEREQHPGGAEVDAVYRVRGVSPSLSERMQHGHQALLAPQRFVRDRARSFGSPSSIAPGAHRAGPSAARSPSRVDVQRERSH